MKVIIIGGGQCGSYIAGLLVKGGHQVKVFENRNKAIDSFLNSDLPDDLFLIGDGTEVSVLEKAGMEIDDIDYFILHQANRRIIEAVAKRLHTDISRFPMNLEEYANTSAATVPILLDEMNRNNKFSKGQKLILSGFGAGLTWAACLFEW